MKGPTPTRQPRRRGAAHPARRSGRADAAHDQRPIDSVAELRADSLEAFDRVLGRIRRIDGIASSETSLLLSTHKL